LFFANLDMAIAVGGKHFIISVSDFAVERYASEVRTVKLAVMPLIGPAAVVLVSSVVTTAGVTATVDVASPTSVVDVH